MKQIRIQYFHLLKHHYKEFILQINLSNKPHWDLLFLLLQFCRFFPLINLHEFLLFFHYRIIRIIYFQMSLILEPKYIIFFRETLNPELIWKFYLNIKLFNKYKFITFDY